MNKPQSADGKKKSLSESKLVQTAVTVLLIVCTLLSFVVVLRVALVKDASLFGYRLFYVVTGSMEPTIPVNSMLLVKGRDRYEVGEVITFYSNEAAIQGAPNTHRIIGITEESGVTCYITQGDANPTPDTHPVPAEDVIGAVRFHFHGGGILGGLMGVLSTPVGFFAIVLVPILLMAVSCMKDFKKAMEEEVRQSVLASMEKQSGSETERADEDTQ